MPIIQPIRYVARVTFYPKVGQSVPICKDGMYYLGEINDKPHALSADELTHLVNSLEERGYSLNNIVFTTIKGPYTES